MRKARLLALVTTTLLVAAIGAQSAHAITIAPAGATTGTSLGTLRVTTPIANLNCNAIMILNWLPGPIFPVGLPGAKAGTVTLFIFNPNPCNGVAILVLGMPNSAPNPVGPGWDIRYNGKVGATTYLFTILGVRFLLSAFGINCLYQGDVGFIYDIATGIKTLQANVLPGVALPPTPAVCGNASLNGGFRVSPLQRIID